MPLLEYYQGIQNMVRSGGIVKRLQVFCLIAVILLISYSQAGASEIIVSFSGIVVDDVLSLGVQNAIVRIFNGNPDYKTTILYCN
jgi:hypothetical protein